MVEEHGRPLGVLPNKGDGGAKESAQRPTDRKGGKQGANFKTRNN